MISSKDKRRSNVVNITIGKNNYKIKTTLYENLDMKISAEDTDSFEKYTYEITASNIEYMTGMTNIRLNAENFYELVTTSLSDLNDSTRKCKYSHDISPVGTKSIVMTFTLTIKFNTDIVSQYTINLCKKQQMEIDRIIKITKDIKSSRTVDISNLEKKMDEKFESLFTYLKSVNGKLETIQNLFKH